MLSNYFKYYAPLLLLMLIGTEVLAQKKTTRNFDITDYGAVADKKNR